MSLSVTNCVQSCERNSSYIFIWIFLKLIQGFLSRSEDVQDGCNPQINFCYFFCSLNLVIFFCSTSTKICRHWVSCEFNSSYNFSWIFFKLCRCFCQGLNMCMTFGCNPRIYFLYIFCSLNFILFWLDFYQSI